MQEKRNTKKIQLVTVIAVVVLFILILVLSLSCPKRCR